MHYVLFRSDLMLRLQPGYDEHPLKISWVLAAEAQRRYVGPARLHGRDTEAIAGSFRDTVLVHTDGIVPTEAYGAMLRVAFGLNSARQAWT